MTELLQFTFQSGEHFFGVLVLFAVFLCGLDMVLSHLRKLVSSLFSSSRTDKDPKIS